MYTYQARVTNIVDGDTVDCLVDLGFGIVFKGRFRLLGIDAPEMYSAVALERVKAQDSRNFLYALAWDKNVIIKTTKADSFGRYLAELFIGDLNINQELLSKGYASVYNHK